MLMARPAAPVGETAAPPADPLGAAEPDRGEEAAAEPADPDEAAAEPEEVGRTFEMEIEVDATPVTLTVDPPDRL